MEEDWKMDAEKLRNLLKDKQHRDAETLRKLIEKAHVSVAAKLLLGIAAETIEHGARLTDERRERFEQEEVAAKQDGNASWDVTTLLAPLAERAMLADAGFYPMLRADDPRRCEIEQPQQEKQQKQLYFLDTDYDTFRRIVYETTYEGRRGAESVPYRLRFVPLFAEAECRLIETAELYRVTRPVIFSPWTRRAVMVEADGGGPLDDLCLEENGLASILLEDRMLYWNFEWSVQEGADDAQKGRSPAFDEVCGIQTYPTKDRWTDGHPKQPEQLDFLLPEQRMGLRSVVRNIKKNQITITGTSDWYDASSEQRCECFRWHRPGAVERMTFANAFARGRVAATGAIGTNGMMDYTHVLRTRAQLDYLLQQLTQAPFSVVQADAEGTVLHRYERGMAYGRDRAQELFRRRARGGQAIRLSFACADAAQEKFLTDYANFVLDALERRAPYITWIAQRSGEGAS